MTLHNKTSLLVLRLISFQRTSINMNKMWSHVRDLFEFVKVKVEYSKIKHTAIWKIIDFNCTEDFPYIFIIIESFGFNNERYRIAKLLNFQRLKTISLIPILNFEFLYRLVQIFELIYNLSYTFDKCDFLYFIFLIF